jgi:hypothetical protein
MDFQLRMTLAVETCSPRVGDMDFIGLLLDLHTLPIYLSRASERSSTNIGRLISTT